MDPDSQYKKRFPLFAGFLVALLALIVLSATAAPSAARETGAPEANAPEAVQEGAPAASQDEPAAPTAPCSGGPTIDGITLDECVTNTFTVGGDSKSITVWYTKNTTSATRTMEDGTTRTMQHWINNDSEAQDIADWGQEAWELFYDIFNHHPYNNGCSDNIDVQLEDLASGAGVAYWASSGNCTIGIDSPTVRSSGAQRTTYHEFQHYLQYSFDDGCYNDLMSNYDDNAEFVEGYADLAEDSVNAAVDNGATGGTVNGYDPTASLYDEGYMNVFTKYFVEHAGTLGSMSDPEYGWDAVDAHYTECDNQDTLYVLDTVVPALTGMSLEEFFLDFFAANWAKDWAEAATQPELVYYDDDDGTWYGDISIQESASLSGGSQSWTGETTPDDWAGKYYEITPLSGCPYVMLEVDGETGANLGINMMAADTVGATSVLRSAWIGEDFTRTFAGNGVHDKIVVSVNAFANTHDYDVTATCASPTIDLMEPKPRPNSTLVGSPVSPIAFLARFRVTSSGNPVRGLPASSFSADAEGDAATLVASSFQEVGDEYWVTMLPPTKEEGVNYVDLELCLDGAICDTNSESLLYVPPGNSDLGMVFDASGSMGTEDVTGEGTRLENAKKAGTVMADLLQNGDRVFVMDFSANGSLDLQVHLARSVIPDDASINDVRNAIDNVTARNLTPIGPALLEARDLILAAPQGDNPKHIILLSDGNENVAPFYADIRGDIMDSGVIVDTISFSHEANEALMSQIAGDTGGIWRHVPTTPGTMYAPQSADDAEAMEALTADLMTLGLSPAQAEGALAASTYLPGPLRLSDVYDYMETEAQSASRILNAANSTLDYDQWYEQSTYVDGSANQLRLVVATREEEDEVGSSGLDRITQVLPPGANPDQGWIYINAPYFATENPPANWDVRRSATDDVVIIANPSAGTWRIRTRMEQFFIIESTETAAEPNAPLQENPVVINGSVQSEYVMDARFLSPLDSSNQAEAGDSLPIVASLMSREGTITGGVGIALVSKPNGDLTGSFLFDDGESNDGAAGDGIYGGVVRDTDMGGSYNARVLLSVPDPMNPAQNIIREKTMAFWINGPGQDDVEIVDTDNDNMPDPWEEKCGLNTNADDSQADLDEDGLPNIDEWIHGTTACDPDTDDGGEEDGSEVNGGRNPLLPNDDLLPALGYVNVLGLNGQIQVIWSPNTAYTDTIALVETDGEPDRTVNMGTTGSFIIDNANNGQQYRVTVRGASGNGTSAPRGPFTVTPREDYVRPQGEVFINNNAPETVSRFVTLNLEAVDAADYALYYTPTQERRSILHGEIPDASPTEMRVADHLSDFADPEAGWMPYEPELENYYLSNCPTGDVCTVYAQFRDATGNVSYTSHDEIDLAGTPLYLPVLFKVE